MKTKVFEIRDRGTFVVGLTVQLNPVETDLADPDTQSGPAINSPNGARG